MKTPKQIISTCPRQQGEHIGEAGLGVQALFREIWGLLFREALSHRGFSSQY